MVTIAVDAMGGDFGPRVTVPSVISSLEQFPDLQIRLYGQKNQITPVLANHAASSRLTIVYTDEAISSSEPVSSALRKKQSSMRLALEAVKNNEADGVVSAGSTAPLVALSRYVLRSLMGIDRPALIAKIPTATGFSYMLDLGANVECDSENLVQFAQMGHILLRALHGIKEPKVALLNIGSEEIKGNEDIRLANAILREMGALNYIGYVEGDDIYKGLADVIVCNGFVGNIALKTSEGLVQYIAQMIQRSFKKGIFSRLVGVIAMPMLERLRRRFNPDLRNGAILLGVQGVVVKSHGKSQGEAFNKAIETTYRLCKRQLLNHVAEILETEISQ